MYALNKAADELKDRDKPIENESEIDLGRGFCYNKDSKSLMRDDRVVTLRRKEMELLEFFIANRNKIVTYEALEYEVWADALMSRDAIRAQIRNLRKKVYAEVIINVTAIGYQFSKEVK
jgi:DNA-binding response OmpR family regulator